MQSIPWRGVYPALTTRFKEDYSLDYPAMAGHLEFLLDAGVHGVVILGSLGENPVIDRAEKGDMVRFYADRIGGRVPLVCGVAEAATRQACEWVECAAGHGADAFMLLPPMRYASDRRETLAYFREVGERARRPVMIYNNPVAYGTDVKPEDFAELAEYGVFQAIKESSGDTRRIADIRRLTGDRFALFCGVDDLAFECFALGAVGWVAGLVGAFPHETLRLYDHMTARRWGQARKLYDWFLPLLHLDTGPKFVQQIKLVEALHGVGSARVRPPRLELDETEAAEVGAVYAAAMKSRPGT